MLTHVGFVVVGKLLDLLGNTKGFLGSERDDGMFAVLGSFGGFGTN